MPHLTPAALWSIPRVGAPTAVAGGRLLVPVTAFEPEASEPTTTLWRLDPATGGRLRFAGGKISGVAASTDGTSVAYLKPVGDHKQVHVQDVDGGEAWVPAELPLGAVGVRWLPDGRLLALATLWRLHPELEATRRNAPDTSVRATEDALYRYWDTWLDHVYHPVVIDPAHGSVTDLTPGATRFWAWPSVADPILELDVSPDGKRLAFSADDSAPPHRRLCWSVFVMELDGSSLRRLDPGREGHSRHPRFTPPGDAIVYGYQAEPDFYACRTQLLTHDLATGTETELAAGWDRSPEKWTVREGGDLVFTAEDRGRSRLWRLPRGASEPEALTSEGWCSDPATSTAGDIYVVAHSLTAPPEIHRVEAGGTVPVTDFTAGARAEIPLGATREVAFTGAGGDQIQMWLVDPPGADPHRPLPLAHMIHGGPHGVFGDAWHWRWNPQVVAAAGYRVALVNFHGSTGWGQDFAASIHGAWGDLPFRDVEAASDHLVAAGWAEEGKMAVTGGSYGGYLATWITSQTDRYACAIAHAAVTSLPGMYASDVTSDRARSYGAEIWDDRAAVERWSPSAHAAGYRTPTLVIHGERDARVPVTQGLELYGVLVAKGVPARLVYFGDENHWILARDNSLRWYGEFLDWLQRWL